MLTQTRSEFSFFETSWPQIAEVALGTVLAFIAIVVVVRINGARTTAQLNSFDWIINVMVGSLAASGILLENVSLIVALVAILIVAALQHALTYVTQRSEKAERVVKAEPVLLTHKGSYLTDAMHRTRISKEEILTVLRNNGLTSVEDANWVILETNGALSVIPRNDDLQWDAQDALSDVRSDALQEDKASPA